MASSSHKSLKSAQLLIFLSIFLFSLQFYVIPTNAHNIGALLDPVFKLPKSYSRTCESKFCKEAPLLRYGKYCGILYTGCPGEAPCDGLDACCMEHDKCIQNKKNDYLNKECNQNLLTCVDGFQKSGESTFKGSTCSVDQVVRTMNQAIEPAIILATILHNH